MDNRKISICIPTWDRVSMTLQAFEKVLNDERVSEIVLCDDCSDDSVFQQLKSLTANSPKVKVFRNEVNIDCYQNKRQVIGFSTNQWNILFDSDNILGVDYLDKIFAIENWDANTVYCPVFAQPHFDYTAFAHLVIDKHNVAHYVNEPMFLTALNTMNFFVNQNSYKEVWDGKVDPVTSDSIYFNYCWLNSGRKIKFVDGLTYFHRVWPGSHYQKNVNRTPTGFHDAVVERLKNLK